MLWLHQVGLARDLRVWAQASPPGGVWQILHRPHSLVIQEEAPMHCLSQALAGARKGPPLLCRKPCSMRTGSAGSPAPCAPCCGPLADGFLPVTKAILLTGFVSGGQPALTYSTGGRRSRTEKLLLSPRTSTLLGVEVSSM